MNSKIGIDVSDYQPILKIDDLRGHIDWMACKACEVDDQPWNLGDALDKFIDGKLKDNVQLAYDLNIPLAVYIFDNPNWTSINGGSWRDHKLHPNSGDPRILALRQALKNKTYHAIVVDVERWWKSYTQYYNAPASATKIPSLWIRDSADDLVQRIKEDQAAGLLRDVPIWIYTAKWVVDSYSPDLDPFLAGQIQWLADYTTPVYTTTKGKTYTWEAMRTLIDAQAFNPKWVGNKRAELLQLTDAVILPGVYEGTKAKPVDVDCALVELAKVFAPGAWSGVTPPPTPEPEPQPTNDLEKRVADLEAWRAKVRAA